MFKIFKNKSKDQVLKNKYKKLMEKAYQLSTKSRTESDKVYAEANEILIQIETLEKNK